MEHVVTTPAEPFVTADGTAEVHQIPSWQDNLIWLVVCRATRRAAAVDGPVAQEVLAWCEAHDLELAAIWNTHTHPDHIGINRDLAERGLLEGLAVYGPASRPDDVPGLTHPVGEGDTVAVGEVRGRVLLTEGHLDGHVSFVVSDALFCGDTLFAGGCGYLFDGPPEAMFRSLLRLAELPGDTKVCCAHEYTQDNLRFAWSVEPDNEALAARIRRVWAVRAEGGCAVPSTMAEECATNPFLRPGCPTLKARVTAAMPDRESATPLDVFSATRALKDRKDHRRLTDADLPLQAGG